MELLNNTMDVKTRPWQPKKNKIIMCSPPKSKEAHQSYLKCNGIKEASIDDPEQLYLHMKRCRSNGVSTLNVRACMENWK